ncbi:glycosyltransferase family 4 protein [Leadbettera azotonutricia]|uniref:Mannosyltransferase n=1 Tax=Leadbettera azotonutricia (strain ATCC BAA-888 / DSM 13862 / ZAS-9) TaxID=545695 RepID=F5YA87_LEAAZ|nr:glycosyltransferase family 1 protein [Leadbettera azotonutricia]AEF80256.1 mannosyltransferase [Leadbettera azotonutricia ZAS-9]
MRIGVDTFACDSGKSAVGSYLIQLLKRIPPSGANYELFGYDYDRFAYSEAAPNMEFIPRCSVNGKIANSLWHIFKYPEFVQSRGWDACFFPAAHKRLPYKSPCPSIGAVHDMAAWWGSHKTRQQLDVVIRMMLPNSLRHLDRIIAVSQWVKEELVEHAGVKESRIEVVPNGIDLAAFHPRPRGEESVVLIQPFSFRRPYVLYASRLEHPLKNHVRLIKAFGIFKERTKYPHRLVLAGADSHGAEAIKKAASESKYRNDIFFTGHFPSSSLPELYAGADMVVMPSMHEGFGMGVLEAMASGVPVVCARAASLPETAEHAALYFDPLLVEDMADRMVTMTTNRDIYRESVRLGLERAQNFSWDRCAEKTLQIIQDTAGH